MRARNAESFEGSAVLTTYAIQAGALRTNPSSGPDGVGVQEGIAYTLEARAEVQAICAAPTAHTDNRPIAVASKPGGPTLRFLSVCSGIEAASVAWKPLGWQAVAFSEIEKFPSAVLAHHYPDVPNLGDFTKIDTSALGRVDILCGGTPCQAFSIAGSRKSLKDARGNLTLAFVELAHELAAGNGLRNAVWENVPGVLSTKDNAFGCFLAGLVGADDPLQSPDGHKWPNAGMVAGPRARAAWRVLDAQYFGLAQRRKRVVVVADFGNGADPAAVLFERKSLSGNSAPRRETGEKVAPTISARPTGGGGLGTDFDLDGGLISSTGSVPQCLNAGGMGRQDYETETMVAHPLLAKGNSSHDETLETYVAHSLRGEGFDASEDGTGRGTPIVPVSQPYTLAIRGRGESHDLEYRQDGTANALLTPNGGRAGIGVGAVCAPVAYDLRNGTEGHVTQSLQAGGMGEDRGLCPNAIPHTVSNWAVRRLTPTECERLQGFPDGYTNIPWRNKQTSPDGPRYKALGNSWAVPKFKWIGQRIERFMPKAVNDNEIRKPDALPRAC
jgi:DNA (cytosine-5)-methyltransferase 1